MYYNNRGSILVTTLIIFSIIVTITMGCIGLYYSNSEIFNLEYKEANMQESAYGAIEIAHSNIIREVEIALQNTSNKDEFNNYFLGNNFFDNIIDISRSELDAVLLNIPVKINIDNENGFLEFNIISTVKQDIYTKKIQASVKIKNPFTNDRIGEENLGYEEKNENLKINLNDDYNDEKQIREFNIKEIVKVYDYKEI